MQTVTVRRREQPDAAFARARNGDADAFMELVLPHDHDLRMLAFRILGDRNAMDDALQEAYVKAFRGLRSFGGRASFRTWLYRIVYNACLDELRRARRAREVPLQEDRDADGAADFATAALARADLGAALAGLPAELRATVLLVDAQGLDYAEAGEILGVPAGTVASRLNRARATLRDALSAERKEEEL